MPPRRLHPVAPAPPQARSQFGPMIQAAATAIAWDPLLLEAQVWVESSDDPWAFRWEPAFYTRYIVGAPATTGLDGYGPLRACSYGLLQVLYQVAWERGYTTVRPERLFQPALALEVGCAQLAWLRRRLAGDLDVPEADVLVDAILAAYNGGLGGNVRPPYRNGVYVKKVRGVQATLRALLQEGRDASS